PADYPARARRRAAAAPGSGLHLGWARRSRREGLASLSEWHPEAPEIRTGAPFLHAAPNEANQVVDVGLKARAVNSGAPQEVVRLARVVADVGREQIHQRALILRDQV